MEFIDLGEATHVVVVPHTTVTPGVNEENFYEVGVMLAGDDQTVYVLPFALHKKYTTLARAAKFAEKLVRRMNGSTDPEKVNDALRAQVSRTMIAYTVDPPEHDTNHR